MEKENMQQLAMQLINCNTKLIKAVKSKTVFSVMCCKKLYLRVLHRYVLHRCLVECDVESAKSKIYTRTPTLYLDFKLQAGATHVQPVPQGWTTFIYTLSGSTHVGPDEEQQQVEPHHTVVFGDGDCVKFENKGSEVSHFVLIAGKPINEPVVQHGPFVMTTEDEIREAFRDYQNGRNGFERAPNWRSKIRDSV